MAISTYTELKASVANWLNREDLTSVVPDFITLLEAQINRELRVREMETRSYSTIDTESEDPSFLSLPSDYRGIQQVLIYTSLGPKVLEMVSDHEVKKVKYANANAASEPGVYSIVGDELEFGPEPDQAYEVEIIYHAAVPELSASQETNWVLSKHPDLYLYGTLMQAAPYLHNDDRIAVWDSGVEKILEQIRVADERARRGNAPLKMRIKPY